MTEDWYRNDKWSEKIEKKFFDKLKRARSQRGQYLVIQASSLVDNFPEVALRLVDFYFDTRKDGFDDVRALLAKTNALLKLEKTERAVEAYRAVLKREEEFPNHQTCAYVDYPYFVATRKVETEYDNALEVLKKHAERLAFPVDCFKWYAAKALIENDSDYASKALDAAGVEKSGFRFHQNVGLVGKEYAGTIKKLQKFST